MKSTFTTLLLLSAVLSACGSTKNNSSTVNDVIYVGQRKVEDSANKRTATIAIENHAVELSDSLYQGLRNIPTDQGSDANTGSETIPYDYRNNTFRVNIPVLTDEETLKHVALDANHLGSLTLCSHCDNFKNTRYNRSFDLRLASETESTITVTVEDQSVIYGSMQITKGGNQRIIATLTDLCVGEKTNSVCQVTVSGEDGSIKNIAPKQ